MVLKLEKSKLAPSYTSPALYKDYPEFQSRLQSINEEYNRQTDYLYEQTDPIIKSPTASLADQQSSLAVYDAGCKAALEKCNAAIDQAHQELDVPYLVDCHAAIEATGHAIYHDEAPLWTGYISDVRLAIVRIVGDQVEIETHRTTTMLLSDLQRLGFGGPLYEHSTLTWEAIEFPEQLDASYWKNALKACQKRIDEGLYDDLSMRANAGHNLPVCNIYKCPNGNYDLLSVDFPVANNLDERAMNETLKEWGVSLTGWE